MTHKTDLGLIGLGTMGSALAHNIAENGYPLSVFNRTLSVTKDFVASAGVLADKLTATDSIEALVASLKKPCTIILMVPAGPIVDQQIAALVPFLKPGDLIVDAGNANYNDTNRRQKAAESASYSFLGMGVSGGEDGARHGPSIMVGGSKENWLRVAHVLNAIAAKYEGESCAGYMGPEGAGHFVKMVHNGIEYADMQMIAEIYSLMNRGLGLSKPDIATAFERWNTGTLASYLIEISGEIASAKDPLSDAPLLDVILDAAGQKGTGRWTAIEAQHLGVAVPVIEAAVSARNLSAIRADRAKGAQIFGALPGALPQGVVSVEMLEGALITGKILCYAQGFAMLSAAAKQFDWALPMAEIARIWRNGCIIRSEMLNDMATALSGADHELLIFSQPFTRLLQKYEADLRRTVVAALEAGIAVPALSAGLSWFDTLRTTRTPANMIQAQRDFFGAHGFERAADWPPPHRARRAQTRSGRF